MGDIEKKSGVAGVQVEYDTPLVLSHSSSFESHPRILARAAAFSDRVDILIRTKNSVGINIQMKRHTEGAYVEPTMRLEYTEAQELMDSLWQCGLRPSEGAGSAGSLKATEKHLNDMRDISLHLLKIKQ